MELTAMGGGGDEAICIGGGVMRERSSARKCNGSRCLGCGIPVPLSLGKCSLQCHSLNDDGSVTEA